MYAIAVSHSRSLYFAGVDGPAQPSRAATAKEELVAKVLSAKLKGVRFPAEMSVGLLDPMRQFMSRASALEFMMSRDIPPHMSAFVEEWMALRLVESQVKWGQMTDEEKEAVHIKKKEAMQAAAGKR